MMKTMLKTFFLFTLMFAPQEGFAEKMSVDQLYKLTLKPAYDKIEILKHQAKKENRTYIVAGVLGFLIFLLLAYAFKLAGALMALVIIIAGVVMFQSGVRSSSAYEREFQKDVLSPLVEYTSDFVHQKNLLTQEEVEQSGLFAPKIKVFHSSDVYASKEATFAFVHIVFDTKANASVERFNQNVFDGLLIMIDKPETSKGVLISQSLKSEVADGDMTMSSFFAQGSLREKRGAFDVYGDVAQEDLDKAAQLEDEKIAMAYHDNKIAVAVYEKQNPFGIDTFGVFDLKKAQSYAAALANVKKVIDTLK